MRTLMRVLGVTAVLVLSAGLVLAGDIRSFDRFPPIKDGTGDSSRGNLDCSNAIEVDISSGQFIHTHERRRAQQRH